MNRFLISASFLGMLSGCDPKPKEPDAQESALPFKKVGQNESTAYVLSLPDKGYIYISADTSSGSPKIIGVSIASSVGTIYSADYSTHEYMILDPISESENIYLISEKRFEIAPESVQMRHQEMKELFADFFGKHIGSGGNTEDIMKEAEELKERLRELNQKE